MIKMVLRDKLNYFEKNLSVKHLSRDIIGFQLLLIISMVVAMLLFLWIINVAVGSSNPEQVIRNAESTSDYAFWFFWIIGNFLVMIIGSKAKREANKTKKEIIEEYENSKTHKEVKEK